MRTSLLSGIILHLLNLLFSQAAGAEIQNMKNYSDYILAQSGDNVSINCTMKFPQTAYFVLWTLDCDDPTFLSDNPLYKARVTFQLLGHQITIQSVTEHDSGMYCCHVEKADGKRQAGSGTWLEVTKKLEECNCKRDILFLVMEVVRITLLSTLIILLCIVIKKS